MNKLSRITIAATLAVFCTGALAASSGIRSSKKNECDEWLCIPGGFAGSCAASYSAMVGRITDRGRHGIRHYTTLPTFGQCIEKAQDQAEYKAVEKEANAAGGAFAEAWKNYAGTGNGSNMTYDETSIAYVPTHKECVLIKYHDEGHSPTSAYCASWRQVPDKYVQNSRCWWNEDEYGHYEPYFIGGWRNEILGSYNRPEYCTDTIHRITVKADGQPYGNPYDYTEKEPAYSGPRPW